jgi:tRNA (guanine-N7-)-methyltransferase
MTTLDPNVIPKPKFDFARFWDWMGTSHELVIEIGCGVGFHPIRWSALNPSKKMLAIERTTEKFEKLNTRFKNHPELQNLFIAHADAAVLLPHLFHQRPLSVSQYFILYPNPYSKSKHKNLRFAHSQLTDFLVKTLKPGGILQFATNIKSYADELIGVLPSRLPLKPIEQLQFNESSIQIQSKHIQFLPRTHFEKKYLERGEMCHHLVFERTSTKVRSYGGS